MFASIASCSACVFAPLMLSICSLFFHCIAGKRTWPHEG